MKKLYLLSALLAVTAGNVIAMNNNNNQDATNPAGQPPAHPSRTQELLNRAIGRKAQRDANALLAQVAPSLVLPSNPDYKLIAQQQASNMMKEFASDTNNATLALNTQALPSNPQLQEKLQYDSDDSDNDPSLHTHADYHAAIIRLMAKNKMRRARLTLTPWLNLCFKDLSTPEVATSLTCIQGIMLRLLEKPALKDSKPLKHVAARVALLETRVKEQSNANNNNNRNNNNGTNSNNQG